MLYLELACHDEQMEARDLFYELGSPSYGDFKLGKWSTISGGSRLLKRRVPP